jgi:hypothetical protein
MHPILEDERRSVIRTPQRNTAKGVFGLVSATRRQIAAVLIAEHR